MCKSTKKIIFSVTTLLAEVVIEIGLLRDFVAQEYKLFIRKCECDGHETFEEYASKTIDFLVTEKSLSFFNPTNIPERLNLGDIECSLTNIDGKAILKASIWDEDMTIAIPNVDAVYF